MYTVPYFGGFTTEEAGGMGMYFLLDGVNNETVIHFLKQLLPGADLESILNAYPIESYKGNKCYSFF